MQHQTRKGALPENPWKPPAGGRHAQPAGVEPWVARLLFPGAALAIAAAAFAVGYRAPVSLPSVIPTKVEQAPGIARGSTKGAPLVVTSSTLSRDHLQVEGFARIGFAQMEELLTTASPEQRELWAGELGALPIGPLKPIALIAFYTAWLDLEPEEALRSLHDFPDLMYRMEVFAALGAAVPTALLPHLMEVISEFSAAERLSLLPAFLSTLAETDAAATARFIDSHPKLVTGSDAAALMSAWAKDDIDAARRWLEKSRFFDDADVLRSMVDSWFAKDPVAAQNYVILHREDELIGDAATVVASRLFDSSPAQAGEFIRRVGDQHASLILMRLFSSEADDRLPEIMALAYTIRDVQKRDETLSILVQSLTAGRGDATDKIRALGLSASQTNHLLKLRPVPRE